MTKISDQEAQLKKNKREILITMIALFAISTICALYVIRFRINMKKYQYTPEQIQQIEKEEQEDKAKLEGRQPDAAVKPKPQSFLIQSTVQGLVQANIRIPVDIKISPVFPCTTIKTNLRSSGNAFIYGNLSRQFAGCGNVTHSVEVLVPDQSTGLIIVDVAYENGSEKYSGSVSIPVQTITTIAQKTTAPVENSKTRRVLLIHAE